MPLFSPQLMKRKRNNNQIFNYFWWMLLREKIWKFINTVKLMIIWIFKQLNSLNKIKLSHKLPSKKNYLLSKTFAFDNSNSHSLEEIRFITFSFLRFWLLINNKKEPDVRYKKQLGYSRKNPNREGGGVEDMEFPGVSKK